MSTNKECFQDLRAVGGAKVIDTACGIAAQAQGTFYFQLQDENGHIHTIELPGSLYILKLPQTPLYTQHWAQGDDDDTYIKNTSTGCWLVWNKEQSWKFVPMDPKMNTATYFTAPGTFNSCTFEAAFSACDASASHLQNHLTYDQVVKRGFQDSNSELFIADEDINLSDKCFNDEPEVNSDDETVQIGNISHDDVAHDDGCSLHPTGNHKWGEFSHSPANQAIQWGTHTFNPLSEQTDVNKENDALSASDNQAELLQWHHCLGHLSCLMLKSLAKNGKIPAFD